MNASSGPSSDAGRKLVLILAIALAVLHQDFWFWDNTTLVIGFMPIGLMYHGLYSLAAGVLWLMCVKIAWPHELEVWADEGDETPDSGDAGAPVPATPEPSAPATAATTQADEPSDQGGEA